jgi:ribonuclease HI
MTPPRSRSVSPLVPVEGETVVYTDGACLGNPGPGGWAWAIPGGPYASGAEAHSTNQRMEITAALKALEELKGPVLLVSDSTYVVNCFRDRWYEGWKRRGWKNTAGKPVANRDLWEPLLEVALDPGRSVRFDWVKGHSGDTMNDRVDFLATTAAVAQMGESGQDDGAGEHFPD